jgi:hypothetical protein
MLGSPGTTQASGRRARGAIVLMLAVALLLVVGAAPVTAQVAPPPGAAAAPGRGPASTAGPGVFYISPFWLALVMIVIALWFYGISWVADDAKGIGLPAETYAALMVAAGLVGLFFTLLLHAAVVLVMGASVLTVFSIYVVVRNKAVPERFKYLGAYHRAELLNRVPLLNRLAVIQPGTTVVGAGRTLTNAAGTSLDDILVEQPGLSQAAEVLTNLVVRAGVTRSRRVRLQPAGEHHVVQYLLDGVLYNLETLEAEAAQQVAGCAAQFLGFSGGRASQRKAELTTELPGVGQISVEAALTSAGGKPVLEFTLPDWTGELFRAGLDALGMHESIIKRVQAALDQKSGAIIICGPPASGKSSTLYAAAGALDVFTTTIALIASKPGPEIEHVRRRVVRETESFTDVYEELLREGPDVLMVGDMTRAEQVSKLLSFATGTGLGMADMVAPDAPQALAALAKLLGDGELVGEAVTCVLSQRLLRKLCTSCREQVEPVPELLQKLRIDPRDPGVWYRPVGCDACLNSGYHGRTAIFGMLILTDPVKDALTGATPSPKAVQSAAGKAAFRTMYRDGIAKVTAGITTLEELQRVLKPRKGA